MTGGAFSSSGSAAMIRVKSRPLRSGMTIAVLGALLVVTPALAQRPSTSMTTTATVSTPAAPPAHEGAFARLSRGNRKIARALHDAQVVPAPTTSASKTTGGSTTGTAPTPLTLDDIAAMKQSGQGWGRVIKDMKSQGLVTSKSLGKVASGSYNATHTSRDK